MRRALLRLGDWLSVAALATAIVFIRTFDHENDRSMPDHPNGRNHG